jgi:predicted acylesterase/phospholipase RssA
MATLSGARIWLSGSIPGDNESTPAQREALRGFVRGFATRVFTMGGHILHGSHPSFVPLLLDCARDYQRHEGKRDCLTLVSSHYFANDLPEPVLNDWRRLCLVYQTPEVPNDQERSVQYMRQWMAERCDAVVTVGGHWWNHAPARAGIPRELELATDRHIPVFLLGALGGVAEQYMRQQPAVLGRLQNGLDEATNRHLASLADVDRLTTEVCDQLARLPLVRGRGADGVSFRILALDGGGIKGTFTAATLAAWENYTQRRLVDHFDLIAGTSTGGILAIGLGLGLSGADLLKFYRNRGTVIFPTTGVLGKFLHNVRHCFKPKYSQETLLAELERAYYAQNAGQPIRLRASHSRLVVPSYQAIAGGTHTFRTPHHPSLIADGGREAAQVALATAAAPTYFAAAKIKNMLTESSYFDGGVWANSPAAAAVVEAVCYLGVPLDRIDVLSVGCTSEPFTVRKQTEAGGFGWVSRAKILKLLMHAQEDASLKHARLLVGETSFLRVDHTALPGTYSLDGVENIEELAGLGQDAAGQPEVLAQVQSRFLNGVPVARWQNCEPTGL